MKALFNTSIAGTSGRASMRLIYQLPGAPAPITAGAPVVVSGINPAQLNEGLISRECRQWVCIGLLLAEYGKVMLAKFAYGGMPHRAFARFVDQGTPRGAFYRLHQSFVPRICFAPV